MYGQANFFFFFMEAKQLPWNLQVMNQWVGNWVWSLDQFPTTFRDFFVIVSVVSNVAETQEWGISVWSFFSPAAFKIFWWGASWEANTHQLKKKSIWSSLLHHHLLQQGLNSQTGLSQFPFTVPAASWIWVCHPLGGQTFKTSSYSWGVLLPLLTYHRSSSPWSLEES